MVMATTRSILRAAAERLVAPGKVLQRANELLYPDIPPNMFVTCLYALLDPQNGEICFANAGHNLPYRQNKVGVEEIRATGMPLGLMEGMEYEEKPITLAPGECLLLSSDGLVEAHDQNGEMLGFPRVKDMISQHPGGAGLIEHLLERFNDFTGTDYDQEDDITLVILEHSSISPSGEQTADNNWTTLAEFNLPSQQGNERQAVQHMVDLADKLSLPPSSLERLKTAVAEATMNAMEHGNRYDPDLPVKISVRRSEQAVAVEIIDHGGDKEIPESTHPDISAKLAGEQSPRGWGLFLIKNMVDEMVVSSNESEHTVQLIMNLKGESDG
jgi:anti-sigma regulatory factor (Ser/Thr protein kinase)